MEGHRSSKSIDVGSTPTTPAQVVIQPLFYQF